MSNANRAKMRVRSQLLAIGTIVVLVAIAVIFDKGTKFLSTIMSPMHFALLIFIIVLLVLQVYAIPYAGDKYFELYNVEPDSYFKRLIPFYNEYILFESPKIGIPYLVFGLLTVVFVLLFKFLTPSMIRGMGFSNNFALDITHNMLLIFCVTWLLASIFRGIGYVRVSADVDRANMEFSGCGNVTSTTKSSTVVISSGAVGTGVFLLQLILFFVPFFRVFSILMMDKKLTKLRAVNKYIVGEEDIPQLEDDDYEEDEYESRPSSNRNRRRR